MKNILVKSFASNIEQELNLATDWLDSLAISLPYLADALPAENIIFIANDEICSESFEWSKSENFKLNSVDLEKLAKFFKQKLLQKNFFKNAGYIRIENPKNASLLFGLKNILKNTKLESLTISPLCNLGHLVFFQFEKEIKDYDSKHIRKLFHYLEDSILEKTSGIHQFKSRSNLILEQIRFNHGQKLTSSSNLIDHEIKFDFRDNSFLLNIAKSEFLISLYEELSSDLELRDLYELTFTFFRRNFAFKNQCFALINHEQDSFNAQAVDGSLWRKQFSSNEYEFFRFNLTDNIHSKLCNHEVFPPQFINSNHELFDLLSLEKLGSKEVLLSPVVFAKKLQGIFISKVEARYLENSDSLFGLEFADNEQKEKFYFELLSNALNIISSHIALKRFQEKKALTSKMDIVSFISSGFSHNFNNILQGVMGQASLIELISGKISSSEDIEKSFLSHRAKIFESTKQLNDVSREGAELIQKISSLNDFDSSNHEISDINNLIKQSESEFKKAGRSSKSNIFSKVKFKLGVNLSCIKVNPQELQAIIIELLKNADENTISPKKDSVTISTSELLIKPGLYSSEIPPYKYISLKVLNTGSGFSENVKKRVFEPFYTSKQVDKGSGLGISGGGIGLTLAYFLAKKNKSFLVVESIENKGTEASLFIPTANYKSPMVLYDS